MALLHGFDVSAYNPNIVPPCDFVFVKATEGSGYTNSKFVEQYASAKERARHRGAYHFARPEQSSAKSQADRFLDVVQPVVGESIWLDLEASQLGQAKTHAWAEDWAARVVDQARDVTYGSYLGSGYATNNTGKDLAQVFPLWWYPQYPGAYQLVAGVDPEWARAMNRSHLLAPDRAPIAARTTSWPPEVTPWLPPGLTFGKAKPDMWQFTDNWQGYDASVTALTLDQLAGRGRPTPQENDVIPGQLRFGDDGKCPIGWPAGHCGAIGFWCDNTFTTSGGTIKATDPSKIRVAVRHNDGTWQVEHLTIGATPGQPNQKVVVHFTHPEKANGCSVTREDASINTIAFDAS